MIPSNSYLIVMVENVEKVVMIGDRVLLKPLTPASKTGSGLYLPPGVREKDMVHTGLVMKVGPGYPIPVTDADSFLKESADPINYVPLQVEVGDQALYLHNNAFELEINGERYEVVGQNAILMVFRDDLSELGV